MSAMPTYAYACTECGHQFDAVQSFSDDSLTVCPQCEGALRKQFGAVGVVFKGGGFYKTDSRSDSGSNGSGSKGADAGTSGSGANGSGGSGANGSGSTDSGSGGSTGESGSSGGSSSSSGASSTGSAASTAPSTAG